MSFVDVVQFLKWERGDWILVEEAVRTLVSLSRTTDLWPDLTYQEWLEAFEGAAACGMIEMNDKRQVRVPIEEATVKAERPKQLSFFED